MISLDKKDDFSKVKGKMLKIDKHLPQIIIPASKVQMFVDWWNTDIRFEKNIPHSFNEGYMFVDGVFDNAGDLKAESVRNTIKLTAKALKITYREAEKQYIEFKDNLKTIILYFKFIANNTVYMEIYDLSYKIIHCAEFSFGENSDIEQEISLDFHFGEIPTRENYLDKIAHLYLGIFASCLWYIATTTKSTKYIYENKTPVVVSRKKGIVQVSDTKFITTPMYDMNKIRIVHVDKLKARKKGWTYSHAFEVHGHYRHYRTGKTIFIEPYIKGKGKEFKRQTLIVNPEN